MLTNKINQFITSIKQNWSFAFNGDIIEKKDRVDMAKGMANYILSLDIEYRLEVLRDINKNVLNDTKQEAVNLKIKELLILQKLEEHEAIQIN